MTKLVRNIQEPFSVSKQVNLSRNLLIFVPSSTVNDVLIPVMFESYTVSSLSSNKYLEAILRYIKDDSASFRTKLLLASSTSFARLAS